MEKPSIHQAPEIIRPLEAQILEIGSPLTLIVEFTGSPKLDVQWFRNGKKITEEIVSTETKTTLVIKKATRKTGGRYEVRVSNDAGEAKTSASVNIVGKCSLCVIS